MLFAYVHHLKALGRDNDDVVTRRYRGHCCTDSEYKLNIIIFIQYVLLQLNVTNQTKCMTHAMRHVRAEAAMLTRDS